MHNLNFFSRDFLQENVLQDIVRFYQEYRISIENVQDLLQPKLFYCKIFREDKNLSNKFYSYLNK